MSLRPVRLRAVAVVLLFATACAPGLPRTHDPLGRQAEPLRSAFNRDAGQVRILMIGGPT